MAVGLFLNLFSIHVFFTAKVLATSGIVYYFHFVIHVLCKCINSALNANELNLYTLYSATYEVQLMLISFNTTYPE